MPGGKRAKFWKSLDLHFARNMELSICLNNMQLLKPVEEHFRKTNNIDNNNINDNNNNYNNDNNVNIKKLRMKNKLTWRTRNLSKWWNEFCIKVKSHFDFVFL